MKKSVFTFVLFCSSLLVAQEEIVFDNSLKPNQKLIQTSIVETNVSSSSVFADTVPQDLVDLIREMENTPFFLSPGGNVEKTTTRIKLTTGEADGKTLFTPGKMEFLEFKVSPDTLETLSLEGLKVYFRESQAKEVSIDSVDLSLMDIDKDSEWLKDYYLELVKSFFPSVSPIKQKVKVGDQVTQDIIVPNIMFPGPITNHQVYTLKEIKDGKGIFEIDMVVELPKDVIQKADPLDPNFEDILYFAITKFNGRGKGRMIFNPTQGIEELELESTTEMELLRFGGSTTTTITTNTRFSENTKPEDQPK